MPIAMHVPAIKSDEFDPVKWWIGQDNRKYPKLRPIALSMLTACATSTSSERLFSVTGLLSSDQRRRMSKDLMNAHVVLRSVLKDDLLRTIYKRLLAEESDAKGKRVAKKTRTA